jgi:hypothetical protein
MKSDQLDLLIGLVAYALLAVCAIVGHAVISSGL